MTDEIRKVQSLGSQNERKYLCLMPNLIYSLLAWFFISMTALIPLAIHGGSLLSHKTVFLGI